MRAFVHACKLRKTFVFGSRLTTISSDGYDTKFKIIMNQVRDPNFKGAFLSGLNEVLIDDKNKKVTSSICKERVMVMSIVMYYRKNYFLVPAVNKVIGHLKSSGLIDHIHYKYIEKRLMKKVTQKVPKEINLSQMLGCFQLLIGGCFISFFCLILEILFFNTKLRRRQQKIKDKRFFRFVE